MDKHCVQILPGIRRLWQLECSRLPRYVALTDICGGAVAIMTDTLIELPVLGSSTCKVVSERVAGGWKQTASLSVIVGNAPVEKKYTAFVVEDMQGDRFLIGSREPPYPVVKPSYNCGNPSGDAAGDVLEISHTAIRTFIPCLIHL